MLKILIGLLAVMLANILLGATLAGFKKEFNRDNLCKGIFKAICIILACLFMYTCAWLNPNIIVAEINGAELTIVGGMNALFIAGIILYSGKDLMKLKDLLKLSTKVEEKKEGNNND